MRIFPESKTRLAITAVGIFLCLASAVFHKDLLAYSTVAMSLRSDGVSNPLDFREIPEAKTKSVLMSA